MASDESLARQLYAGLSEGRLDDVEALLTDDFRGVLAAGMPAGIGGVYDGPSAMRRGVYERVGELYEMKPVVDELLFAGPGRVVVVGRYCGTARSTGKPVEAAFVHLLRMRDDLISELVQVSDTAKWRQALSSDA